MTFAPAIVAYLASKGVEGSRFVGGGFGDEEPVGDNATAEGKANNRRVEFAIVE